MRFDPFFLSPVFLGRLSSLNRFRELPERNLSPGGERPFVEAILQLGDADPIGIELHHDLTPMEIERGPSDPRERCDGGVDADRTPHRTIEILHGKARLECIFVERWGRSWPSDGDHRDAKDE